MNIQQQEIHIHNLDWLMNAVEKLQDGIERGGDKYPETIRGQLKNLSKLYEDLQDEAMYYSIDLEERRHG